MGCCRYATIYASSGLDQTSTDDGAAWNDAPTSTDGLSPRSEHHRRGHDDQQSVDRAAPPPGWT